MTIVLAFDMGASSGRLTSQYFNGEKIEVKEIHRFQNGPQQVGGNYYWNYSQLVSELKNGLEKVEKSAASVGIDTWGVDVGLLNAKQQLLSDPFSYRDTFSIPFVKKIEEHYEYLQLYKRTGNEISAINTLFQLQAIYNLNPQYRETCSSILLMPNLFIHALSNMQVNELSIASTTQLMNANTMQWDEELINKVFNHALPLAPIERPHQIIGTVRDYPSIKMALVPGHDTACALSALPIINAQSIFISLGTWGIIGMELESPVLTEQAFLQGFTNERTSEGNIRFQKNAPGFWILQKLREEWAKRGEPSSFEFERTAFYEAEQFTTLINPSAEDFFNPESMEVAIEAYCRQTEQTIPITKGQFIHCVTESIALYYTHTIQELESITNCTASEIYIGGGGAQNEILCQLLANATQKIIKAGPIEASSIGNGLSQLRALNEINSIQQGREIVKASFELEVFEPMDSNEWQEKNRKFAEII